MADGRDHLPNQTVTGSDEGFKALPRDPNQSIHKKPRVFLHKPNEEAPDGSIIDAAKTIKIEDFSTVHQTPCFRNAMLPGISSGAGIGALRFIMGGSFFGALNWASGGFIAVSVVMYQRCQWQRNTAKDNIRKAAAVLEENQALKTAQAQAEKFEQKVAAQGGLPSSPDRSGAPSDKQGVPFWSTFKFW